MRKSNHCITIGKSEEAVGLHLAAELRVDYGSTRSSKGEYVVSVRVNTVKLQQQ